MGAAAGWLTKGRLLGLALAAGFFYVGCSNTSRSPGTDNHGAENAGGSAGDGGDSSGAAGAESGGTGGACSDCEAFASRDSAELFAWESVPVFDFTLPPERWAELQANARDEQYVEADVSFEGVPVSTVGLRFKGSFGTLQLCFDELGQLTCPKLSMKVSFDEYTPEARFFGLKKLNFHSMIGDATKLHERLGYDLYREMGIYSPRSAWAVLRVNGESYGLFSMVEQVDGRFTDSRWPEGNGNLYKEAWPNLELESDYAVKLQTNEDTATHEAFLSFHAELSAAEPDQLPQVLARYSDLEYLNRYMAVDDALLNVDGVTTFYCSGPGRCGNHNYYMYQEEQRAFFWLIPWDLDATWYLNNDFAKLPHWTETPSDCSALYPIWGSSQVPAPGCDPMFRALGSDRSGYESAVQELLDGPFQLAPLLEKIASLSAFIAPAIAEDPLGPGTAAWQVAVDQLEHDIPVLRQRLEALRDGEKTAPVLLALDQLNDFESESALGVSLGVLSYANPRSSIAHALNLTAPLDGARDLRVDFEYRDQDAGWETWSNINLKLSGGEHDVSQLRGIRLLARTDRPRMLRIDLESPKHLAANQGIRFGWEVAVSDTTATIEVLFEQASLPAWAPDTGDDLALVLAAVTGLSFQPFPLGRDANGFLGATTDPGYLQLDAIEFLAD